MAEDDDTDDDDEIWAQMCGHIARRAGISAERTTAILWNAGYHAYGHTGLVEAFDVVFNALGRHPGVASSAAAWRRGLSGGGR